MTPASEAYRECHELVGRCLREAFGELVQSEDASTFLVPGGPYGMRVRVSPIGEDEAVVDVCTWLGRDLEATPQLARYLLEENARLRFGALAIDPDGDIVLAHALFPDALDGVALERLIKLMAAVAVEIEAELSRRFA